MSMLLDRVEHELKSVSLDLDAILVMCGDDSDARAIMLRVLSERVAMVIAMSARVGADVEEIAIHVSSTIVRESLIKLMAKRRKPAPSSGDCQ